MFSGLYQGFECNFRFSQMPFFWASSDNLDLKHSTNTYKQVAAHPGNGLKNIATD